MEEQYQQALTKFIAWAEEETDIRTAYLVGSRAREDHPADAYGDMDLLLFSTHPEKYLADNQWLAAMGKPLSSFVSKTANGDSEWLTLYQGGFQIDYVLYPADAIYAHKRGSFHGRGIRLLVDKDGLGQRLIPDSFALRPAKPPVAMVYGQVVQMFWFVCYYMGRQIARGEVWPAKMRETDQKSLLLVMMEWHAHMVHGLDYDTWHAGRYLHEWLDEDIYRALPQTFRGFEKRKSMAALLATETLFHRLAKEVGEGYGFPHHAELAEFVLHWTETHLEK
ncbi:aminoglycoside 6-adenylyltransferase [Eubacteriales bacterium OttesenSCG-928-M02]|nr:aminoglycoside 6-adenylyltransferase [Eubacteriales bacterium OttesenSCG-928-M02]